MHYTLRATRRQYRKIPILLRMLGSGHRQDVVRRPAGLPVWQLLFSRSGSGEVYLDGRRSLVRPGQLVLLPPDIPHGYRSTEGEWVVDYLGFNGSACGVLLSGLGLNGAGVYSLARPERFAAHISALEAILTGEGREKSLLCSKELYSTLLDLSEDGKPLPLTEYSGLSGLAREVVLHLEEHYSEDVSLSELSEQFHLTPEYLCERFKAETGQTVMQYLKSIRLHQARMKLMELPDVSTAEIGRACGFRSPSYFGKVFKEVTGFTPQGFRMGTLRRD